MIPRRYQWAALECASRRLTESRRATQCATTFPKRMDSRGRRPPRFSAADPSTCRAQISSILLHRPISRVRFAPERRRLSRLCLESKYLLRGHLGVFLYESVARETERRVFFARERELGADIFRVASPAKPTRCSGESRVLRARCCKRLTSFIYWVGN